MSIAWEGKKGELNMSEDTEETESTEPKVLRFGLELKRQPVELQIPDGPILEAYILELTGSQRDTYLDMVKKQMKMKGGKVDAMTTFKGLNTHLLTLSLHKKDGDKLFLAAEINEFPAQVQSALHEAAQELSGLEITLEEKKAKNDSEESD